LHNGYTHEKGKEQESPLQYLILLVKIRTKEIYGLWSKIFLLKTMFPSGAQ